MPVVLRIGGYRFFFFSKEGEEPPHIHVESAGRYAKFWLDWIELAENLGYNGPELRQIKKLVEKHRDFLKRKWDEYFGHE